MNLSADIQELFSGLDGRDQYQWEIALWCEWRRAAEARRQHEPAYIAGRRQYQKRRYRTMPEVRDRHLRTVKEYRFRKGRRIKQYGPIQARHGDYVQGYSTRGCRCALCRASSAEYMRNRRAGRKAA